MTVVRPTQIAVEVLVFPNPHARVTQIAIEVIVRPPLYIAKQAAVS